MRLIRRDGALTIRDIDDDVLVDKDHLWASRKPSKRALQFAFYTGALTISERNGMLKTYELMARHFGWDKPPKPASAKRSHRLSARPRAARAGPRQPRFDLPSRCAEQGGGPAPDRGQGPPQRAGAGRARRRRQAGALGASRGARDRRRRRCRAGPHPLAVRSADHPAQAHELFFGYDHRFEAYVPKEKRLFGYFALPVLVGDDIVAAIDLKTDRKAAQAADAEMDLGRQRRAARRAQGLEAPDRGGTAPLRAFSARGVSFAAGSSGFPLTR